ncbi:MAG: AarF/ABC1/UbiB kinase family protein [Nitrospirae bacterium]|nr:AarF/ABC1/UbiB kinase family protein [Nitrospirota bacterium]
MNKDARSFRVGFSDLNRLRKILTVVSESGGGALIDQLRLKYLIPFWSRLSGFLTRRTSEARLIRMETGRPVLSPDVLRSVLERLGPTFIKLGQVLSLRADVVGEALAEELSKFQSDAAPFPGEEARRIFKEETGRYPEEVFKSFEETPVAAASLAQVHRAVLKDGTEVAVKIQRPGIRKMIEQDVHIFYYLAGLAERFIPELRVYQPVRVVREFADWTLRELDFGVEGHNAERFAFIFKENPQIYIPKIFWDFTTPRVITMEFSHGVKANDLGQIGALGLDRKQLASIGVDALFHQFFISGFFHADPHPGNFFAMPDGRLCLHDFGMVGYLDQRTRKELLSCLVSFVNKDVDGFIKHILHMALIDEKSDVGSFEKDVAGILSEFFFSERRPSVAWAFFRVINRGAQNGIRFPGDLALFGKALVTTESMGLMLYPEFDFNRELEPFVKKAMWKHFSPAKTLQTLEADILDYLGFIQDLPDRVQGVLTKLERGEIGIKFDAGDLKEIEREFDRQNDLRILGIVLTAVFFGMLGLLYLEGTRTILGFSLSALAVPLFVVLLAWFFIRLRQGPGR